MSSGGRTFRRVTPAQCRLNLSVVPSLRETVALNDVWQLIVRRWEQEKGSNFWTVAFFCLALWLSLSQVPFLATFRKLKRKLEPWSPFQLSLLLNDQLLIWSGLLSVWESVWYKTGASGLQCLSFTFLYVSQVPALVLLEVPRLHNRFLLIASSIDRIHAIKRPLAHMSANKGRRALATNAVGLVVSAGLAFGAFTANVATMNVRHYNATEIAARVKRSNYLSASPYECTAEQLFDIFADRTQTCDLIGIKTHIYNAMVTLAILGNMLDCAVIGMALWIVAVLRARQRQRQLNGAWRHGGRHWAESRTGSQSGPSSAATPTSKPRRSGATAGILAEVGLQAATSLLASAEFAHTVAFHYGWVHMASHGQRRRTLLILKAAGNIAQIWASPFIVALTSRHFRLWLYQDRMVKMFLLGSESGLRAFVVMNIVLVFLVVVVPCGFAKIML